MNRLKIGIAIYLCTLFPATLFSQSKVDAYMEHLFRERKFMGSVAIVHKDSIIYSKAVGYADFAHKQENNPDTKFRIGSISKTFTAVLVLQAIEAQKLSLSDKLSTYYPEIKNADKISIAQLLQQRSGIFNFTENPDRNTWEATFHTEKEVVAHIAQAASVFEPGTAYEYSNSNYVLLGYILERIYQKPFATILEEKICKVAGLKNTYFTETSNVARNEALSYNIQDSYLNNAKVNFSNHPASGGIASTASDVNKFLSALFGDKLISKESLKLMLPVEKGNYGMGIFKLTFDKPDGFEHSGRIENYISEYWYFPGEQLGIVSLANAINIDIEAVNMTLLQFAYGKAPELTDFNKIAGYSPEAFKQLKGTYKAKKQEITISSDGNNLVLQTSGVGQDYLPFEDKGNNSFEYKEEIKLQFFPERQQVLLEQGKAKILFRKHAG